MLLRFDPFRELDRLVDQVGAGAAPRALPMDAVRRGDRLTLRFDLPGIRPEEVELVVERNQLTITADRPHDRAESDQWLVAERPAGRYSRQVLLGDNLDTDHIEARLEHGVLELTIPVAEAAKPRRVELSGVDPGAAQLQPTDAIEATSHAHGKVTAAA